MSRVFETSTQGHGHDEPTPKGGLYRSRTASGPTSCRATSSSWPLFPDLLQLLSNRVGESKATRHGARSHADVLCFKICPNNSILTILIRFGRGSRGAEAATRGSGPPDRGALRGAAPGLAAVSSACIRALRVRPSVSFSCSCVHVGVCDTGCFWFQ